MKTLRHLMLGTLLIAGAGACGGGADKPGATGTGGMMQAMGGAPGGTGGMTAGTGGGGGGMGGAGGAAITLVDWVTDLTTNYTNTSAPDTVDKNIIDTDDPAAFDPLLQP